MTNLKKEMILILALLTLGLATQQTFGQCSATTVRIAQQAFSYEVESTAGGSRIRFFLNATNPQETVHGFDLSIHLDSAVTSTITHNLGGSWIFRNATVAISLTYHSASNSIHFRAIRQDCIGQTGAGFIGELNIPQEIGVRLITGGICLLDNIDLG